MKQEPMLSARIVLRPRNLGEIFDLVLPFTMEHARFWLRLTLAVLPALALIGFALMMSVYGVVGDEEGEAWILVPIPLLFLMMQDVYLVATSALMFEREVTVRGVLSRYRRVALRGFWCGFLLALWNVVTLLCVIGLFFAPTRGFVREAALLERAGPGAAFRRSAALTQGLFGHVFGYWLLAWLMPVVVGAFAWIMGNAICEQVLMIPLTNELEGIFIIFGLHASAIPAAIARFFMYVDLRTRKEGWDLQLRFAALAALASQKDKRHAEVAA